MIPDPKLNASSKSSFRWPWSRKRKGPPTIIEQTGQVLATERVEVNAEATNVGRTQSAPTGSIQGALPVVSLSTAMASISGKQQLDDSASRGVNKSTVSGLQITPATSAPSTGAVSSFLPNASGCIFHSVQINAQQHRVGASSNDPGWERLMQNAAPNALHDSEHRFDPPKCDEETRVEVTEELMGWILDRESPHRLLCMTGAAGSGKSALQQTVAEQCSGLGILASTFFFSSADPTRNTVSAVIPTIAYQLGSSNLAVREAISAAVDQDPLIFKKSLKTQMTRLVVNPVIHISRNIPGHEVTALPYTILIDGLDECADEQRQAELLATIDDCLLQNEELPFRVFIASRPEWAIRSALEESGYLHEKVYHIQLSDQYDATGDIRRVLWRRLRDIGRQSSDPRARSASWPSKEDVETLVVNASGQFIYAATVIKFVSERRSSPVDRLQTILTWTPEALARPFAALDLLYTNIVSTAKEAYEAAHPEREFLVLLGLCRLLRGVYSDPLSMFAQMNGLEDGAHRSLISDLRSLITEELHPGEDAHVQLRFYHKSFTDFLDSPSRSQSLFVSKLRILEFAIAACLRVLDSNDSVTALHANLVFGIILLRAHIEMLPDLVIPLISTGTTIEKIERWEKLDKCVRGDFCERSMVAEHLSEHWLELLSCALLDQHESNDQEFHRAIQALYDKGQQFYEENCPKGKYSDVDVEGGEDRISL